jgi:cholesterol transport system auxiliary component
MSHRAKSRPATAAAVALALLAGCTSPLMTGEEAPPETYRLTAPDLSDAALPSADARLVVGEPSAASGLETSRIAVVQGPQSLDYYADARWAEPAPEMVKGVLVAALQTSGALEAVGRRSVTIDPEVRLRTEITDLQAVYAPGADVPLARVGLHATLITQPGRDVLGSERFVAEAQPASAAVPDVVAALDRAADRAVADLVAWTLRETAAGR